jgi:hypothetical protein
MRRVTAGVGASLAQLAPVRAEYDRNAAVWLDIFREGIEDGVRLGAS